MRTTALRRGRTSALRLASVLALGLLAARAGAEPLASWNDGAAKQSILAFVEAVTREGGPAFVPPADRIAVFDNDGTLWAEQPLYVQFQFALERVKALAPQHPEWKTKEPFRHLLAGDTKAFLAGGERSLMAALAASHSGMTTDEFEQVAKGWLATARHPKAGRLYTEMVYAPMLELLAHLRERGFDVFIVSGGGVEFLRAFAERVYGVPPQNVIGSQGKLAYQQRDGRPVLVKLPEVQFVDDKEGKPAAIQTIIGRRPILAFGNSDGDHPMLQWTAAGGGRRFAGLVHHTDGEREWAYDRASAVGRLDAALDEAIARGWTVVDMKRDWKRVFAFDERRAP